MSYFSRAIKYLLSLCIIYVVVIYAMSFAGVAASTPEATFASLISTSRGIIMIIAILALSFSYPVFGFMRQEVTGDMESDREAIISSFAAYGFSLRSEGDGEMVFGSDNLIRKITLLFEDKITVTQVGNKLVVEGIRRVVPSVIYRLEAKISFSEE
ncbi:MAG: hypothetical protein SNH35_00955 [Rikenellaceae bacterium]